MNIDRGNNEGPKTQTLHLGLYAVAQEILYHEFILGYGDSWKSKKYSWDRRLTSFMRTMSRRRDLAARVQRVSIHPLLLEPFDKPRDAKRSPRLMRAPAIGEARMALKRSAAALNVDLAAVWKPRWTEDQLRLVFPCEDFLSAFLNPNSKNRRRLREALESSQKDQGHRVLAAEMVAMLIALLPNLEHLSLLEDGTHWPQLGFPNPAFQALGVSNLPLKILDTEIPRRMVPMLATNIEELNIRHCQQFYGCPKMPALKILRVAYVEINKDYLDTLMSCCTGSLHTFVYETLGPGKADEPAKPEPRDIIGHLETGHVETLQTLHLDMRVGYYGAGGSEQINIRDFTALRHVLLSTNIIFGWQHNENSEEKVNTSHKYSPRSYRDSLPRLSRISTRHVLRRSRTDRSSQPQAASPRAVSQSQKHQTRRVTTQVWERDSRPDDGGSRCELRFRKMALE
ncbi:hypothetical protein CEP52_012949 [Fusarium oligoseptatum]|uniref:Uncharacterized protein n=1 Tax=Fusarium oligoseptatum TaxID=2604345 RepID=A0A428SVR8_9HYPO|nr:hypothetical protein CEP52_012949 [Fusarium oligoseptatum]